MEKRFLNFPNSESVVRAVSYIHAIHVHTDGPHAFAEAK